LIARDRNVGAQGSFNPIIVKARAAMDDDINPMRLAAVQINPLLRDATRNRPLAGVTKSGKPKAVIVPPSTATGAPPDVTNCTVTTPTHSSKFKGGGVGPIVTGADVRLLKK